jgi:multisubunit Na+/H+ antiporter MnhF subunit
LALAQSEQEENMDSADSGLGQGWKSFAGVMIIIVGCLNIIDGLVAIFDHTYYAKVSSNGNVSLTITNNIKTWGWVELILGIILILAGYGIFSGATWARVVGVTVAGLNLLMQFAWLPHYPFWSLTMIVIDVLIIYGLIAHGGREPRAT